MWQKLKSFVQNKFSHVEKDLKQCEICFSKYNQSKFINLCSCQHKFCKQCIKIHVQTQIKNYQIINCLKQQCKSQIHQSGEIYLEMLKERQKIYEKIKRFHFVSKNPDYKLCPKEQCKGIINIKSMQSSFCNVCQQKYCTKCLYKQHRGKCEKQSILHLQNDFRFVQCMRCDFIIEKNQGCDHIKCRCGYELCYKCGGLWKGAGHFCIRSKNFQKARSFCLIIQDKLKLRYRTSHMQHTIKGLLSALKKVLFFNIVFSILITVFQIFVNTFILLTSIFCEGNETDSNDTDTLSFEYFWPYLYLVLCITIALSATYLDGSLKLPNGRINFIPITLITLVAYYYLPNLLYLFYYQALAILFIFDNALSLIVILLTTFTVIITIFYKYPEQQRYFKRFIKKYV